MLRKVPNEHDKQIKDVFRISINVILTLSISSMSFCNWSILLLSWISIFSSSLLIFLKFSSVLIPISFAYSPNTQVCWRISLTNSRPTVVPLKNCSPKEKYFTMISYTRNKKLLRWCSLIQHRGPTLNSWGRNRHNIRSWFRSEFGL